MTGSATARLALAVLVVQAACAHAPNDAAPLSRSYEQSYLRASHNWAFRRAYRSADRLFNAFDYGHAKLSELLYTEPRMSSARLDAREFRFIVDHVLPDPPDVPLEERAIAPGFSRLAPELELTFEWAHMLHRQLYDVWADDRLSDRAKDERIAELVRYYQSRADLALSGSPKSMAPMEGRRYSTAFRRRYPTFNGLIWSYHWLQLALYEVLMTDTTRSARQAGVKQTIARFNAMTACPSSKLPTTMPMAAAVAPKFTARYPEAAAIFDNLHSLHDVVSDILVSSTVPADRKREALLKAAAEYRDAKVDATSVEEWREMAIGMGVDSMGGPAVQAANAAALNAPCRLTTGSRAESKAQP